MDARLGRTMLTAAQTGAMIFMRLGKIFQIQVKAAVLILPGKGRWL